ncbi:MAG TPA: FAD-dependent monooxygenase [Gemmatimonadaceae bacterium]
MRILISGGGIAGLTLGHFLAEFGHEPLVVEQNPSPAVEKPYMIDFFGAGWEVADRMDLLPALESIHQAIPQLEFLDAGGQQHAVLKYTRVRQRLFQNRHTNVMRDDLQRVLYDHVRERVPVRFATSVTAIDEHDEGAEVHLSDGSTERVALVVGADGLHSQVRELVFGPESRFVNPLGYMAAAYVVEGSTVPELGRRALYTLTAANRQVSVFPLGNGLLATFFLYRVDRDAVVPPTGAACGPLSDAFSDFSWFVPNLLDACASATSAYHGPVVQIQLPRWRSGSVVLIGDACHCLSVLAGQGASVAMGGAYLLATELQSTPGVRTALARYQWRLEPSIARHQASAIRMARWFVPSSKTRLVVRDKLLQAMLWPGVSALVRAELVADDLLDSPLPAA